MVENELQHRRILLEDTVDDRWLTFPARALQVVLQPRSAGPQDKLEMDEAALEQATGTFGNYALEDAIAQVEQGQLRDRRSNSARSAR